MSFKTLQHFQSESNKSLTSSSSNTRKKFKTPGIVYVLAVVFGIMGMWGNVQGQCGINFPSGMTINDTLHLGAAIPATLTAADYSPAFVTNPDPAPCGVWVFYDANGLVNLGIDETFDCGDIGMTTLRVYNAEDAAGTNRSVEFLTINLVIRDGNPPLIICAGPLSGYAASFDGADDYVDVAYTCAASDVCVQSGIPFTMSARFRADNVAGNKAIITIGNDAGGSPGSEDGSFGIGLIDDQIRVFYRDGTATVHQTLAPDILVVDKWYHVAVTYDGTNDLQLWLNGVVVGTLSDADLVGVGACATDEVLIGRRWTGNAPIHPFDGLIDDVRFWRADKSTAIPMEAKNYSPLSGSEADLEAYYDFEDGTAMEPAVNSSTTAVCIGDGVFTSGATRMVSLYGLDTGYVAMNECFFQTTINAPQYCDNCNTPDSVSVIFSAGTPAPDSLPDTIGLQGAAITNLNTTMVKYFGSSENCTAQTNVQFVYFDASGNSDTCMYSVIVTDTFPPSWDADTNKIIMSMGLSSDADTVWNMDCDTLCVYLYCNSDSLDHDIGRLKFSNKPRGMDNCDSLTSTLQLGGIIDVDTTCIVKDSTKVIRFIKEVFILEDNCGNVSPDTFAIFVMVRDTQPPVFNTSPFLPALVSNDSMMATSTNGNDTLMVWASNTTCGRFLDSAALAVVAHDSCNPDSVVYNWSITTTSGTVVNSSGGFVDNVNMATLFAVDTVYCVKVVTSDSPSDTTDTDCANLDSIEFKIVVKDTSPPMLINCPMDLDSTNLASNCLKKMIWTPPSAFDNCDPAPTITPEAFDPNGNPITLLVGSPAGSCMDVVDFTGPFAPATTPGDPTTGWVIDLNGGGGSVDESGVPGAVVIESDGGFFGDIVEYEVVIPADGILSVHWINFKSGGLGGNVAYEINGNLTLISIGPGFSITTDVINVPLKAGDVFKLVKIPIFPGFQTSVTLFNDFRFTCLNSGSHFADFPVGTSVVRYIAEDSKGNKDTCEFNVTVRDIDPPVANCQDVTVNLGNPNFGILTAANVDNNSADPNCVTIDSMGITKDLADAIKDTLSFGCSPKMDSVWLIVFDASDNADTCAAKVTVIDNVPPVAQCTSEITVYLDATGNAGITLMNIDSGSTDNCLPLKSISIDIDSFKCINAQQNFVPVTLTVMDSAGLTDDCFTKVIVKDTVSPTAICQNVTVQLDSSGTASVIPAQVDNGSSDACGIASMTVSPNSFTCANAGNNSVTLTVTDVNGNVSQCMATVKVEDNLGPQVVSCPGAIMANADAGQCDAVVTYNTPLFKDNCNANLDSGIINNPAYKSGQKFPVGVHTVIWTYSDGVNNISCSFTVTVIDNQAPTLTLSPKDTFCLPALTNCNSANFKYADSLTITANDNCPGVVVETTPPSNSIFPAGINPVVVKATDAAGLVAFDTFYVKVVDNIPPTVSCQPVDSALDINGFVTIQAIDFEDDYNDNCGSPVARMFKVLDPVSDPALSTYAASHILDCAHIGTYKVMYRVFDGTNYDSCMTTMTIRDTTPPTAICATPFTTLVILDPGGMAYLKAQEVDGGSTDNCNVMFSFPGGQDSILFDCEDAFFPPNNFHTVTLIVTDSSGNVDSCQTQVYVFDTIAPVIVGCPDMDTLMVNTSNDNMGDCSAQFIWQHPQVFDTCGLVEYTFNIDGDTLSFEPGELDTFTLGPAGVYKFNYNALRYRWKPGCLLIYCYGIRRRATRIQQLPNRYHYRYFYRRRCM